MEQKSKLPANRNPRAAASYYGFNSGFWPVDAGGTVHLLGDGGENADTHMLDLLQRRDTDEVTIGWNSFTDTIAWYEVMHAEVGTTGDTWHGYAFREISEAEALNFDPSGDGFDDPLLWGSSNFDNMPSVRIRQPGWQFVRLQGQAGPGVTPNWASLRYSGLPWNYMRHTPSPHAPPMSWHDFYNPFQCNRFLVRWDGNWHMATHFDRYIVWEVSPGQLGTSWWRQQGLSHATLPDRALIHPDEFSLDPDDYMLVWSDLPPAHLRVSDSITAENLRASRFAQVRVTRTDHPYVHAFTGTPAELFDMKVRQLELPVEKIYLDGLTVPDSTVPAVEVEMTTPTIGGFVRQFHFNEWENDEHWHVQFGTELLQPFGGENPFAFMWWQDHPPLIETAAFGVVLRRDAHALHTGIGTLFFSTRSDELTGPPNGGSLIQDYLLLRRRGTGQDENDQEDLEEGCMSPSPGTSWSRWGNIDTWWTTAPTTIKFTALLSDDDDAHDPRANAANAAVQAYLAGGDGLMYEGPLGRLPRPYSGTTAVFCGRELTVEGAYTVEVLRGPTELLVLLVQDDRLRIWRYNPDRKTAGDVIWDRPLTESIPPAWLEAADGLEPTTDLRFLHPAWPTPTGVLTIGGRAFITAIPDRGHRGMAFEVPVEPEGGGPPEMVEVSPPVLLFPGWADEDMYFAAELRCPIPSSDPGNGGGDPE